MIAALANSSDVIVALITTTGVIVAALVKLIIGQARLRHENRYQHEDNRAAQAADMAALAAKLGMVHDDVKTSRSELRDDINRVHERINDHIRNHDGPPAVEEPKPRTVRSRRKKES